MNKRMSEDVWDIAFDMSKETMNQRIQTCACHFGWQHAVRLILERNMECNKIKIAEVGCGTGTLSLTFCLLGASVTLLDFNQRVLEKAKKIFDLFDCEADFIQADCMEPLITNLRGKFDVVISGGLAEHFIGEDRKECIRYHRLLLKEGGFAYIAVPNKLSPFYQWVKAFKKLTGTWNLEIEVPFTKWELRRVAASVGFKEAYIIGNAPLKEDLVDYARGFGSAVKELFSFHVRDKLQIRRSREGSITDDMRRYCHNMASAIGCDYYKRSHSPLVNTFSAGLILFAFN